VQTPGMDKKLPMKNTHSITRRALLQSTTIAAPLVLPVQRWGWAERPLRRTGFGWAFSAKDPEDVMFLAIS